MVADLIKCNRWLPKTNIPYMRIFSIGLNLLFSNLLQVFHFFTNVPLDETIEIILNIQKNEISTDITKSEMKQLLNLCTKSVHFTFEVNIYV